MNALLKVLSGTFEMGKGGACFKTNTIQCDTQNKTFYLPKQRSSWEVSFNIIFIIDNWSY